MAITAAQPNRIQSTAAPIAPAAPTQSVPRSNQNTYLSQTSWSTPNYIDPSNSISNTLAKGYQAASPRSAMKQMDRAGFSRGKGQQYRAAMASAQSLGDARMSAAGQQLEADTANAQMRTDFESGREMEAQRLARIQDEMANAEFSVQQAQNEALARLYQTRLSGTERVLSAFV